MIILLFLMTLLSSIFLEQQLHGLFPLYIERMLYIPLTVTAVLLLNRIFRRLPDRANRIFRFVGSLSLECYLLHIHFVLAYLPRDWGYWVCLGITLPAAWLLNTVVGWLIAPLEHKLKAAS